MREDQLKTIAQLARELGLSKQGVFYIIDTYNLRDRLIKVPFGQRYMYLVKPSDAELIRKLAKSVKSEESQGGNR
jgi:hypothetical protein